MSVQTAAPQPGTAPFYLPAGDEVEVFSAAYADRTPVLLKGPTGTGKTRFLEHMAWRLAGRGNGAGLTTIACHEDVTAADLVGRFLLDAEGTRWVDGPLTRAVREGAICYLDEVVEARKDVLVVVHSLTDHRRTLPLARTDETVRAHEDFLLVVSYNPGYQLKELKHSTRQRFVAIEFGHLGEEAERQVLVAETGVEPETAQRLVELATRLRRLAGEQLVEGPSTRLLVHAARLMRRGLAARRACEAAIVAVVGDDAVVRQAAGEVVATFFPEPADEPATG